MKYKAKSGLNLTPNPDAIRQMAPHRRETNLHGIADCRWPFSAHFGGWAVAGDGETVCRWARTVFFVLRWEFVMAVQLRSRTFCRWASVFLPSQGSREQKSQAHQLVPVGFFWAAFCWSWAFGDFFGAFVRHFLFTRWRKGKRPVEFAR